MKRLLFFSSILFSFVFSKAEQPTVSSYDTICSDSSFITISASSEQSQPRWYKNGILDTTLKGQTITVPVEKGAVYEARTALDTLRTDLLNNGSFEGHGSKYQYSGFTSSFTPPIQGTDTITDPLNAAVNYFDNQYGHHYAIISNAQNFWNGNYPITPHSGNYCVLYDITDNGFAWKASTQNNPKLILQKDSFYEFSFWVNTPNQNEELDNPNPKLIIELTNCNTQEIICNSNDGIDIIVKDDYRWQNYRGFYVHTTEDCSNVEITITNLTASRDGNDFCLDDITFSRLTFSDELIDTHTIITIECENDTDTITPPPPSDCVDGLVYAKWDNMLFVDKGQKGLNIMGSYPIAFQWFKDNEPIEGENGQIYYYPYGMNGKYHCLITLQNGTEIKTCPHTFQNTERSAHQNPGSYPTVYKTRSQHFFGPLIIDKYTEENGEKHTKKYITQ